MTDIKTSGTPPTGEDILKTLIELLEEQEQIKITYTIKKREPNDNIVRSSNRSFRVNG